MKESGGRTVIGPCSCWYRTAGNLNSGFSKAEECHCNTCSSREHVYHAVAFPTLQCWAVQMAAQGGDRGNTQFGGIEGALVPLSILTLHPSSGRYPVFFQMSWAIGYQTLWWVLDVINIQNLPDAFAFKGTKRFVWDFGGPVCQLYVLEQKQHLRPEFILYSLKLDFLISCAC